jgi:TRAP-type C4-dicarboxylate transport system permease small subunit
MQILDKISDFFGKYVAAVIGIALLIVTLILTVNVIGRYGFGVSLTFGEELATYTIIWITFVGSGICVKRGIHVSVDAFVNFMPRTMKKAFLVFGQVVGLVFSLFLIYIGIIICGQVAGAGQMSPAMRMPMAVAYAAIPVGAFYMTIEYIRKLIDMAINGVDTGDDDVDTILDKSI